MAEALTEQELAAIVATQIELAKAHDKSERMAPRAKALDYYFGRMDRYVPAQENRSKVVSRDTADTIGWMLPGIMRVFTASDRMAIAEPVAPEDVQWAREATDALNYVFWKDNRGYEIVYAATWDALLVGNGVVKTYFDAAPVYKTSFHSDLTEDELAQLTAADDVEVLAHTEHEASGLDGVAVVLHDVKIKARVYDGRFVIEAIPPEEFLIDGDAVFTADAAFTDHWQRKTRSDLVAMGYDKAVIARLPEAGKIETPEGQARRTDTDTEASDASMELVDYHECYVRIDVDGDGEAELCRVCYGGDRNGQVLAWEVWEDETPFDDIPCEPVPHRWDARSVADETMDVQEVKTVLSRQMLTNTYWANNPQRHAKGRIENPEELYNPTFGGTVFGAADSEIVGLEVPYVANHALEQLGYQDEVIQRRTGVSRQSMALDPETLQNQTATAAQAQRDASYSQVELIARNMAEWGWSKVFRKLLRLMIRHQNWQRQIMLAGKPVVIDPRHWNADMDVTINVGLGTGSRDRDLAMLGSVLQSQLLLADRFMASGATEDAIDMLPKIIATMTKMAESAGIKNPEDFYPEYAPEKVAQLKQMAQQARSQPDPKVQADIAKTKADMQLQAAKAQTEAQLQAQKMQQEQAGGQAELALKREQIAAELQLKREQLAAELQLKREQIAAELQLQRELGAARVAASASVASDVRPGGEPG